MNSDDQGARFDLEAQIYRNGNLIGSATSYCITGVTRNPAAATGVNLPFGAVPSVRFDGAADVFSLKLRARMGTSGTGGLCGGHASASGLRLYFDGASRASGVQATFGP
jgi:hypothetical protein